ncbi:hypothetical protein BJX66DRAFT_2148 [Aspergillus keveii]|uniref:Uncharacterized protein n=1 Tax=Aspergillus keveii TaxID=714993 RepID=A0ABR4GPZ7_9EURO
MLNQLETLSRLSTTVFNVLLEAKTQQEEAQTDGSGGKGQGRGKERRLLEQNVRGVTLDCNRRMTVPAPSAASRYRVFRCAFLLRAPLSKKWPAHQHKRQSRRQPVRSHRRPRRIFLSIRAQEAKAHFLAHLGNRDSNHSKSKNGRFSVEASPVQPSSLLLPLRHNNGGPAIKIPPATA